MSFTLNDQVIRIPESITAEVGQNLVVLGLATNRYIGLNPVGRRVWDLLAAATSVQDLCRTLAAEFTGAPEQIAGDVLDFLDGLAAEQLVQVLAVAPGGPSPAGTEPNHG